VARQERDLELDSDLELGELEFELELADSDGPTSSPLAQRPVLFTSRGGGYICHDAEETPTAGPGALALHKIAPPAARGFPSS